MDSGLSRMCGIKKSVRESTFEGLILCGRELASSASPEGGWPTAH